MLRPLVLAALSSLVLALACSSPPPRTPAALANDFCDAAYGGRPGAAGQTVTEANRSIDPKTMKGLVAPRVADWLRALPCVESVSVNEDIIATDPGIQEITFVLRAPPGDVRRSCDADLTLRAPWPTGIHASSYVSTNPDHRCTPVP